MKVVVNGEAHEIDGAVSLDKLLKSFELDSEKVAIECNLEIVHRCDFEQTTICDGDRLEIVHFIGGG